MRCDYYLSAAVNSELFIIESKYEKKMNKFIEIANIFYFF